MRRNLDPTFIYPAIETRLDDKPGLSLGPGNEMDDGAIVRQRLTSPVHRDEGEQSVLDLVPFARARRKVTHRNRQALFCREGLQLALPQRETIPVAAPAVCADQKATRARIAGPTHVLPPLADALDCKFGGVAAHPHVDPPGVLADVVDTVRHGLGHLRIGKIVREHLDRISFRAPLPAGVFIGPYELLLFGVIATLR